MILPDLNLLIYAYKSGAQDHLLAKAWWEDLMTRKAPIGLPLAVATGFIRLMTNPRVIQPPMPLADAIAEVKRWLASSNVTMLPPGDIHWDILQSIGWIGPAVSDAHLAALAIERSCDLHTNDADFHQCPGVRWHHPLAQKV